MAFKEVTPRNTCEAVRRDYIMDTDADLAQIPTSCATGSRAFAVDSGTLYMLNASGVWAQVGFTILKHPESVAVSEGTKVPFKVIATGTGLTYQWQYYNKAWYNSTSADATSDTLTVEATSTRNGFKYRCKVTNANGAMLISKEATLQIDVPVSIPELYE